MVSTHFFRGLRIYFFCQRIGLHICLSAVGHIECFCRNILAHFRIVALIITRICSIIAPIIQKCIIMTSHPSLNCPAKALFCRQRLRIIQVFRLNHRIAKQDKAITRCIGKKIVNNETSVIIHMLCFVPIVFRIIPLAPGTYKSSFKHIDHIRIFNQMRFELLHMLFSPFRCGIYDIRLTLRIGKTQYTFQSMFTKYLHILIKTRKHFFCNIFILEIFEII